MSRDYGRLGGNRRSSGTAVWQWVIIGGVFGMGCSLIIFLGLLIAGFVGIDPTGSGRIGSTSTAVLQIITATPDTSLPTQTPIIITATVEEKPTQEGAIIFPSPTIPVTDTPAATADTSAQTAGATATTDPAGTAPVSTQATPGDNQSLTGNTGGSTSSVGVPQELANIMSQLVPIDAGTFVMGTTPEALAGAVRACQEGGGNCQTSFGEDSLPPHQVSVSGFQIERTEVSYEQYVAFLSYLQKSGKNHLNGCGVGGIAQPCADTINENANAHIQFDSANYDIAPAFYNTYPVVNVTWYGANAYCQTLGRRLPTEAEWEWAARGSLVGEYPWGDTWDATLANGGKPADQSTEEGPQPVDAFADAPSAFGAINMVGNVGEWVSDWYSATIYSTYASNGVTADPKGPERGTEKVIRGGNWADNPFFARTVHRLSASPANPDTTRGGLSVLTGFRCAANAEQPASSLPGSNTTGATPGTGTEIGFTPPAGTPDPASLGVIATSDQGGGAPTLPPAPTSANPTAIPSLPPGG